ncbi:MAG: ABC transporter ATP-binding protein [Candidatus Rokubacteria bacterium]|nr:ABC transporter ATP-binding protein [Candidatus Rokubacteria bacterium]
MRLLGIRALSKRFGGLQAVDGLTLALEEGEVLGLIGPNGAGKTTAFHLISGFLAPDAGEIHFRDRSLVGLRPHQVCHLGLTRTFQIARPFPHLSVLENVKVGAFARTASSREAAAKAGRALEEVGLLAKAGGRAGELTLAERKRLELARALATDPSLLLLDEVMAGLSAVETERIVELIRAINARGVSILLIEHVMRAVMSLSHRVAVLNYGQLIAEGPPAQVANAPNVIEAYLGEEYVGVS